MKPYGSLIVPKNKKENNTTVFMVEISAASAASSASFSAFFACLSAYPDNRRRRGGGGRTMSRETEQNFQLDMDTRTSLAASWSFFDVPLAPTAHSSAIFFSFKSSSFCFFSELTVAFLSC